MSWIPSEREPPAYRDWNVESDEDRVLVGTTGDDSPLFFDPERGDLYVGYVNRDGKHLEPDDDPLPFVDPDASLADALERVGEELGLTWLSAFARERVDDGE
ncbi:MAG: hypothetical protein ABEJ67_03155 [Halanaeroarchaeum sp.]